MQPTPTPAAFTPCRPAALCGPSLPQQLLHVPLQPQPAQADSSAQLWAVWQDSRLRQELRSGQQRRRAVHHCF